MPAAFERSEKDSAGSATIASASSSLEYLQHVTNVFLTLAVLETFDDNAALARDDLIWRWPGGPTAR